MPSDVVPKNFVWTGGQRTSVHQRAQCHGPELIQLANVRVFFCGGQKGRGYRLDGFVVAKGEGARGAESEHMSCFLHTGGRCECILSWRIISIRMQTQQECAKVGAKHLSTMQQRIGLSGAKAQKHKKWPC